MTPIILSLFVFGIMAGSVLGLPIGPNGTLCLYRSLRFGWMQGMATALGSVTAMVIHAMISFMLLTKIMGIISHNGGDNFINIISGVISIIIGVVFYLSSGSQQTTLSNTTQKAFFINYISAFAIGIVNPKNIFGFAALLIAGNLDLGNNLTSAWNAASFGSGVFLSTFVLFLILIYLSITLGEKFLRRIIPRLKYWVSAVFVLTGIIKILQII
jgi:threonine/homoserine/homoserine lactone efflux protein